MIDYSVFENKKVAFYTLGCKLNFSETSTIARQFKDKGFHKVDFNDKADVYVINTCSVTDVADKKCRYYIHKAIRKSPNAYIVVTGCYAQLKPDEISSIPGVDLVVGANDKFRIFEWLNTLEKNEKADTVSSNINNVDRFEASFSYGDRTRSFLKVQDGCDYFCTYCTIPFARGKSRNASVENVVSKAEKLAEKGIKEIILTGVNIGDFGKSTGEDFLELIQELDKVEGIHRFRISSIEPNLLSDDIIRFIAGSQRFAPHFHMPIQSGSNKILKLMKRRYNRELFEERVKSIRQLMPDAFIGVDVIVGTRGETESDFEDSYHFIRRMDVSQLHVFTYSERANTKALDIDYTIPVGERRERSRKMQLLSHKMKHYFYARFMGETREVLWEDANYDGKMYGFTDNYIKMETDYDPAKANKIERVTLGDFNLDGGALCAQREEVLSI